MKFCNNNNVVVMQLLLCNSLLFLLLLKYSIVFSSIYLLPILNFLKDFDF